LSRQPSFSRTLYLVSHFWHCFYDRLEVSVRNLATAPLCPVDLPKRLQRFRWIRIASIRSLSAIAPRAAPSPERSSSASTATAACRRRSPSADVSVRDKRTSQRHAQKRIPALTGTKRRSRGFRSVALVSSVPRPGHEPERVLVASPPPSPPRSWVWSASSSCSLHFRR
jgi:hypothetical protein